MTRVVCVGDVMVDVHAALTAPLARGTDTPARIELRHGGAAANVAAWLAHLGAVATFVGRVGADRLGDAAVQVLDATGVRTRVEVDPHRPTGTCIVLVEQDGERTMVPSAGANDAPPDAAVDDLLGDADWLYASGYSLLRESTRESMLASITAAHRRGVAVAVDAASAAPLSDFGPDRLLAGLDADVTLLANVDEASVLLGDAATHDAQDSARLLARRFGHAVVKLGAAGAVWSNGVAVESTPARVTEVVDTTGAGDAFAAGYLAAGGAITERLASGVSAAADVVGRLGARPL